MNKSIFDSLRMFPRDLKAWNDDEKLKIKVYNYKGEKAKNCAFCYGPFAKGSPQEL